MSEPKAASTTPMKSILAGVIAVITTVVVALTGGEKDKKKVDDTKSPTSQSRPELAKRPNPAGKANPADRAKSNAKPTTKDDAAPKKRVSQERAPGKKASRSETARTKATPRKRSRFDRSTSTGRNNRSAGLDMPADGGAARVESLFKARRSDAIVTGSGTIHRVLADDNEGSRHQKWILKLSNNRTILFAHNIDLAKRVPLERGDEIEFRGEYEFSERGGVIHWTHHDPRGRHEDGFIRLRGKTYK